MLEDNVSISMGKVNKTEGVSVLFPQRFEFTASNFKLIGHINSRKCISLTITGIPEIVSNGTSVSTKDDDIAHFTCTSRGEPSPLLRWERNGATVKDSDEGVAILSKSNASLEESHLFIAVTGSGRRGNYICVATNEEGVAKQSFTIVSKLNYF